MLRVKDDALDVLDRGMDRIANLAEMTALSGAVNSPELDAEVRLRRASAARSTEEFDTAADLATSVRESSSARSDRELELKACLELGQAITRCPLGEGYWPLVETDLDAAEEPFQRALELARELGFRSEEAAALRELAVIEAGRVKLLARDAVEAGVRRYEFMAQGPEVFAEAKQLAEQAFHIYEELGDHRGSMSALISMAYAHVTDPTPMGMAGRLEHIRALHNSKKGEITDSQRAGDDALMLYSIHVFARDHLQPDLAVERGRQAFEAARSLGDRWLECLAAGGVGMAYLSFGATEECSAWLDRAADAAMTVPSNAMAWRLEMWRGALAGVRGASQEMIDHYERAADLPSQKNVAGRAEAHSALATTAVQLGARSGDEALLARAERAALDTLDVIRAIPGDLPWEASSHATLAVVSETKGDHHRAADEARTALTIDGETHVKEYLHVLWAAARTLIVPGEPEGPALAEEVMGGFMFVHMSISDPEIESQWFSLPTNRELAEVVGFSPPDASQDNAGPGVELDDEDLGLLRELASGFAGTRKGVGNGGADDQATAELLDKIGATSVTEAMEFAIKAGITWQ